MLEIKNLSFKYEGNRKIISNFDFSQKPGELVSFVGSSGVGKTTLISLLNGMLSPTTGNILIDNQDIVNLPIQKRPIVTMFQGDNLFPHMNVLDNILFGLKTKNNKSRFKGIDIITYAKELLAQVELAGYERRFPHELSGGQKQRVALARAIAVKPKVLLLDEPFSALDPQLKFSLNKLLKKIINQSKLIVIKITHDLDESLTYSDRVLLLTTNGIYESSPDEIKTNPLNKEFIQYYNNGFLLDDERFILSKDLKLNEGDEFLKYNILSKQTKGQLCEYLLDINGQTLEFFSSQNLNDEGKVFFEKSSIRSFVY